MDNTSDFDIFSPEFLEIDPGHISQAVDEAGYFCFPRAVQAPFLEQLKRQLAQHRPASNHNDVSPVWLNEQYFFPHAMASCQHYFRYVTADFLRSICQAKLGSSVRLKCHRYYETSYGHSMEWHADNVTNEGVVTDVDGLIFILYVSDVDDGEFQLVSDSYRERKDGIWSYNYTNSQIEEKYGSRIKSFRMPAGSIIIYDTYGIHRAKPITTRGFTRKSIFFQVDASEANAEKMLLNPSFIHRRDDDFLDYLGFGKRHDFLANPPTTMKGVPIRHLLSFQYGILRAIVTRTKYGLNKLLFSHDQRMQRAEKNRVARLREK